MADIFNFVFGYVCEVERFECIHFRIEFSFKLCWKIELFYIKNVEVKLFIHDNTHIKSALSRSRLATTIPNQEHLYIQHEAEYSMLLLFKTVLLLHRYC